MKTNNILLDKEITNKTSEYIVDKINVQNVTIFYQLAKLNKLTKLAEISPSYIERCFAVVVESDNFLELQFNLVAKILSSSELSIHSELEIINAATKWLQHNSEDRSKFAKQLLQTVRLPLLSDPALHHILDTNVSFTENNECVAILKEILANKEHMFFKTRQVINVHLGIVTTISSTY